ELGPDAVLGPDELGGPAGRVVAVPVPRARARADGRRARVPARRDRRGVDPAPAHRPGPSPPVAVCQGGGVTIVAAIVEPREAPLARPLVDVRGLAVEYGIGDRLVRAVDGVG